MLFIKCRKDIRMEGKTTSKITYEVKIKKANWLWIAGAWKCHWASSCVCNRRKDSWCVCGCFFFDTYCSRSWNRLSWAISAHGSRALSLVWSLPSTTSNTIIKSHSNLLHSNTGAGRMWVMSPWGSLPYFVYCCICVNFSIIIVVGFIKVMWSLHLCLKTPGPPSVFTGWNLNSFINCVRNFLTSLLPKVGLTTFPTFCL